LDRATAVYADLGQGPEPSPVTMIARLAAMDLRAVVIVDNCPPDAHKVLADLVGRGGPVSLLTIEYDVRDDTPEGSEVFRLDTASAEVIERLLARRVPHLSDEDRRRIVTLSDCNSRLALAVADAAPRRGGLDRLDKAELFHRLFWQRNAPDTELQRAAQVCALVYFFDVEEEGEGSELTILAGLAEVRVGACTSTWRPCCAGNWLRSADAGAPSCPTCWPTTSPAPLWPTSRSVTCWPPCRRRACSNPSPAASAIWTTATRRGPSSPAGWHPAVAWVS
ncbi:MAG: hypothetical protein ACM3W4_11750, partial [Ignavibacteriales bacterium]